MSSRVAPGVRQLIQIMSVNCGDAYQVSLGAEQVLDAERCVRAKLNYRLGTARGRFEPGHVVFS
jgi:hypothetical protein